MSQILTEDEIDQLLNAISGNTKKVIKTCVNCGQEYNEALYEHLAFFDKNICECDQCQKLKFNRNPLSKEVLEKIAEDYLIREKNDTKPYIPNYITEDDHKIAIETRAKELREEKRKKIQAEILSKYLEESKELIDESIKESSSDMEFLQILIAKVLQKIDDQDNKAYHSTNHNTIFNI